MAARTPDSDRSMPTDNFRHIDASSSAVKGAKRRTKAKKASHACASCRRQKSRCEILGNEDGRLRCHRCKVLGNTCSYEESDSPPFPLPPSPQESFRRVSPTNNRPLGVIYFSGEPHLRQTYVPTRKPGIAPWSVMDSPSTAREYDWAVAPMLAVDEVIVSQEPPTGDQASLPSPAKSIFDTCLMDVLSAERTQHLLHIFDSRFFPWLNLPSTSEPNYGAGQSTPLLDLIRCTVAARHLDPNLRSSLLPRLRKLTEEAVARQSVNPVSSLEVILSLLILSLWPPSNISDPDSEAVSPKSQLFDGMRLMSSAVSIATTLKLNQAAEHAVELQGERDRHRGILSEEKQLELTRYLHHAYIWIAVTNIESMLCIGTGQSTVSKRSTYDRRLVNIPAHATNDCVRELRLGLQAELFDHVERGYDLRLNNPESLSDWSDDACELLFRMNRLHQIADPLPLLIEHESFLFYMHKILYSICRLVLIYSMQSQCRHLCAYNTNQIQTNMWHKGFSDKGVHFYAVWSQDGVDSTESILLDNMYADRLPLSTSSPIPCPHHKLLSSAPDRMLCIITFAATLAMMTKCWVAENAGTELMGGSVGMLKSAITILEEAALLPNDYARKCSIFVRRMVEAWDNRGNEGQNGTANNGTSSFVKQEEALPTEAGEYQVPPMQTGEQWYSSSEMSVDSSPDSYVQETPFSPPARPGSSDLYIDKAFFNAFSANFYS